MDLAEGHAAALAYAQEHTGAEVFNLGTGRGTSVLEIINAFQQATGVTVPYVMAGRRAGDAAVCYAGTEKAAQVLHWRARRSLVDMCRDAWRWQQCGGGMNTSQKIRDTQGVSRIFLAVLPLGEEVRSGGGHRDDHGLSGRRCEEPIAM